MSNAYQIHVNTRLQKVDFEFSGAPLFGNTGCQTGGRPALQKAGFWNWRAPRPSNKWIVKFVTAPPFNKVDFEFGTRATLGKSGL